MTLAATLKPLEAAPATFLQSKAAQLQDTALFAWFQPVIGLAQSICNKISHKLFSQLNEKRRVQAEIWAELYVNVLKSLTVSTMTLSFLPFGKKDSSSGNSAFDYFVLVLIMLLMPLVLAYLIVASLSDYFGLSNVLVQFLDSALIKFGHGISPTNAAAALDDPPIFLGYTKAGQQCQTRDNRTMFIDASKPCNRHSFEYVLKPALKAASILGTSEETVSSDYVRFKGPHMDDIASEASKLKIPPSASVEFDMDVAKLMSRFSALTYELSYLPEVELYSGPGQFTVLERFGFPSNISCQILFKDKTRPQLYAVVFWCVEDGWITVAFRGAAAWSIGKQLASIRNDTVSLKSGGNCHLATWKALCNSEGRDKVPFQMMAKELDGIRKEFWPDGRASPSLFLTGQGSGGSLAELFIYLKLANPEGMNYGPITGYMFGSLGVGDEAYCADFNKRANSYFHGASLFTIHNSLDLFGSLPVGLHSAGRKLTLYTSWEYFIGTRFVHISDFMFCALKRTIELFDSEVVNALPRALIGDRRALLTIIFSIWSKPPKPLWDRLPISYFRNLTDPRINIVEEV